jgi:hypothetical protein
MVERLVTSVVDLLKALEQRDEYMLFRGHGNGAWPLVPSIGRPFIRSAKKVLLVNGYEDWKTLEDCLLEEFIKYSPPFLSVRPASKLEWLVLAQHHGLPTRLLDWNSNPLKALFFAVENPVHKDDGAVWALSPNGWWTDVSKVEDGIDNAQHVYPWYPDHSNPRIAAQEGCFTIFPLPSNTAPLRPLRTDGSDKLIEFADKLIIPAGAKEGLRIELKRLGVTHQTLFPGLDGLATRIRRGLELPW